MAKTNATSPAVAAAKKALKATVGTPTAPPKAIVVPGVRKNADLAPNTPAASAPVVKTPLPGKRISHLKLGPELILSKASQEEINAAFVKSFNDRGVSDPTFIAKRIAIYMKIAAKKVAAQQAAAAAKTGTK